MNKFANRVTRAMVEEAIERAVPFFELLVGEGRTGDRKGIHIVCYQERDGEPLTVERTLGDLDPTKHDYQKIATSKAHLTWDGGRPTDQILLQNRAARATIYYGSVFNEDFRLAIAGSGLQAYYDRLLCRVIEAHLIDLLGDPTDLGEPSSNHEIDGDFLAERK